ncbi:unnamed protein product [Cunninghamella blakesleeana]
MRFEDKFREIVLKSASQFDEIAISETRVDSEDNHTSLGKKLEDILLIQKQQREELWAELNKLEEECQNKNITAVFGDSLSLEKRKLALCVHEEAVLTEELNYQEKGIDIINQSDPVEVTEIQYRKRMQNLINDLRETKSFMESQLIEVKSTYEREEIILKECHQLHESLNEAIIQQRLIKNDENGSSENQDKLVRLRERYQRIMDFLVEFLDEHYPPHFVDGVDLTSDPNPDLLCELKYILEDLMNRAVVNPTNSYITLEKGTFWSPYIETLVKGGIAERDPNNYLRIRLSDFSLY